MTASLGNKRILLGVTGGIAAYKSAELLRRLQDEGAEVRVVMTRGATEFITPLTMAALSQHPVHLDLLNAETESAMGHIEIARWADLILVAPATADFMARLQMGRADDLLTAVCLAATCDVALAPAMNQAMWSNPGTQNNVRILQERGYNMFGPASGLQACGEEGAGRLLDVPGLVELTAGLFPHALLAGKRVLITAGPTREAIDPVRFITNHSSGKQGYSLAEAAVEAGAQVTLVSGPVSLTTPERVRRIDVMSAREMCEACLGNLDGCDIFIGVAAVSDYRPVHTSSQKIKKTKQTPNLTLELVQNPDIIASVASASPRPYTVGFAAETHDVADYARGKLISKKLDMIVANDVSDNNIGFNSDHNETTVIWPGGEMELPMAAKSVVSRKIISLIAARLIEQTPQGTEQTAK